MPASNSQSEWSVDPWDARAGLKSCQDYLTVKNTHRSASQPPSVVGQQIRTLEKPCRRSVMESWSMILRMILTAIWYRYWLWDRCYFHKNIQLKKTVRSDCSSGGKGNVCKRTEKLHSCDFLKGNSTPKWMKTKVCWHHLQYNFQL